VPSITDLLKDKQAKRPDVGQARTSMRETTHNNGFHWPWLWNQRISNLLCSSFNTLTTTTSKCVLFHPMSDCLCVLLPLECMNETKLTSLHDCF